MTLDEFIDENAAPDGVAVLADGGIGKVKDVDRSADVQGNLLLAARGLNTIRESAGVTSENRGLEPDAQSVTTPLATQDKGSVAPATNFENLYIARMRNACIE